MSANPEVEKERTDFRKLIVKNPNYFGNLKESKNKAVTKITKNTKYEELHCVGFDQNLNNLEAAIAVKLSFGYGGKLCSDGSREYVRFFINYGAGWLDAGLGIVNVHDIPDDKDCEGQNEKPLIYVASCKIQPYTKYCKYPVIPKVRAILSWQIAPPPGPANVDWSPIWGDVMECNVQILPRRKWWKDFLSEISEISPNIKIPEEYHLIDFGPLPDPPPLTLAQLSENHRNTEAHRFGLTAIQPLLTTFTIDQDVIITKSKEWNSLGLDLSKSIEILENTKANVDYEELECLGLDYNQEKLVATVRIKRKSGYSGPLCTSGSFEYISFWADWEDTCKWTLLGIKKINVHDFDQLFPDKGICYSAVIPVDLSQHRQSCEKPKISRVRAVLSWNVPPSSTDPDDLQYWGNRLDSHVQIKPIEVLSAGLIFNQVHEADIDNSTGMTLPWPHETKFVDSGNLVDAQGRACPFGGKITLRSYNIFSDYKDMWYKAKVYSPKIGWTTLSGELEVIDKDGNWNPVPRDSIGIYYKIQSLEQNEERVLYRWISSIAGDDACIFLIEVRSSPDDTAPLVYSTSHKIQLDNTLPKTPQQDPDWAIHHDRIDIHIKSGGDCKTFKVGDPLEGEFVAQDSNFGSWSIQVLPAIVDGVSSPPVLVTPPPDNHTMTADPPGSTWTLNTAGMEPCGYVVYLVVSDRSIVGTGAGDQITHNSNSTSVGFCLE